MRGFFALLFAFSSMTSRKKSYRQHLDRLSLIQRDEEVVCIRQSRTAHALRDEVFHRAIAIDFANASQTQVVMPLLQPLRPPLIPQDRVMRERRPKQRLRHRDAGRLERK